MTDNHLRRAYTIEGRSMFHLKHLIRVAGGVCLAILLSGCVIAPAPYYHHGLN
jgi:hypothetical protein